MGGSNSFHAIVKMGREKLRLVRELERGFQIALIFWGGWVGDEGGEFKYLRSGL